MNQTQPKSFFFSPEYETQAKVIEAKYPDGCEQSTLIPLLDLAQRQHGGWLPRAAVFYVADRLGLEPIKAFEVASFYTMFNLEPVGTFLVQLCRTTPCWLKGGEAIARACEAHLGIKLGETTPDGKFTLKEVECLGACVNAPVMQINDDYYEDLTPENVVLILDDLANGRKPQKGSQSQKCGGSCTCRADKKEGEGC
jgi:NADH-quinone oxidoreductase subunit E